MRNIYCKNFIFFKLLFFILIFFHATSIRAQFSFSENIKNNSITKAKLKDTNLTTCDGESQIILKDDFGSGTADRGPKPSSTDFTTTYQFSASGTIPVGGYSIMKKASQGNGAWSQDGDHTTGKNGNGYMLVFDANSIPGSIFYSKTYSGLCTGSLCTFSIFAANIVAAPYPGGFSVKPKIKIDLINPLNNTILKSMVFDELELSQKDTLLWNELSLSFTIPEGLDSVTVSVCNSQTDSNVTGNDVAFDDVVFSICVPPLEIQTDNICMGEKATLLADIKNTTAIGYRYQWQQFNGSDWIDIAGATSVQFTTPQIFETTKYRVRFAPEGIDITNNRNLRCSGSKEKTIIPTQRANASDITLEAELKICAGTGVTITPSSNISSTFYWYDSPTDNAILLDNSSSYSTGILTESKTYYVAVSGPNYCENRPEDRKAITITVNDTPKIAPIAIPASICPGSRLTLTTPIITENGSSILKQGWYLDNIPFNPSMVLTYRDNNKSLVYKAENSCGQTSTNPVTITINDKPSITTISAPDPVCAGNALTLITPTINENGSPITEQGWFLNNRAFDPATILTVIDNYKVLFYKAKNSCGETISNFVQITVNKKPADIVTEAEICSGETYIWPANNTPYTTPQSGLKISYEDCTSSNQILNLTVVPRTEKFITTSVTICKGDNGSLEVIPNPTPTTMFRGHWNPATDPKAAIPNSMPLISPLVNSPICQFSPSVISNYTATSFTVNLSGIYQFKMTDTNLYDGIAYIYSGNFTPGTCSGEGAWIIGDDDDDAPGTQKEPRMTTYLQAGITYTLISTLWGTSSLTYTGDYTWTVTPPEGGAFFLNTLNYWYTGASGGTSIGWGPTFNPVGVPSSGLSDTNTAGITTYYVGDGSKCSPRTPITFTILEDPSVEVASSTPTACINTPVTKVTHATTGVTGIRIPTGLPLGVTATWASNTITISGTPTTSGIFDYNIPLLSECGDIAATGKITVTPKPEMLTTNQSICFGKSFTWDADQQTYTASGTYIKSNDGCTPDQVLNLTVGTKPGDSETTESICFGESFRWSADGQTYTASGIYRKNNDGCTPDQVLNLTVGTKPGDSETTENICFRESFHWSADGQTYTASGTYRKSNDGCTADQVLNLTVGTKPDDIVTPIEICFGASYEWSADRQTYTASGIYRKSNDGCTADQVLNLIVGTKPDDIVTPMEICFGGSFHWSADGQTYTASGTYRKSNDGCTPDQVLNLTVGTKPNDSETTESICFGESFLWSADGQTYTASGTYRKNNDGCTADQVLNLTVGTKPGDSETTESICFGESFHWSADGQTYTASGTYRKSNDGCTPDQVLNLTVGTKPSDSESTESICFGESFHWSADGQTYTTSGTYRKSNDGCTPDQVLNLTVGTKPGDSETAESICFGESFHWSADGQTYAASGTYRKSNDGCTPDQVLNLTVGTKPGDSETAESICFGEFFLWSADGQTYAASGTYRKSNDGCTPDQVLNLTVGTKPGDSETAESICFGESFHWSADGQTYTASGIYRKNNDGCTPDQVLNLTVGTKPNDSETTESICFGESFHWSADGQTYTASGTYRKNNDGCTPDQVLNLTVGTKPNDSETTKSICFGESFHWSADGQTYTASGTYRKSNDGCTPDQVLNLTVGTKPGDSETTESICFGEFFHWSADGQTYTASGTYRKNNDGCTPDQVLNLTVGTKPNDSETTESICFGESFLWSADGQTYTASGTYRKSNDGCTPDQVLNLSVGEKPETVITNQSICFGESFLWSADGQTYTASGIYRKNNDGCTPDQVLNLSVALPLNTFIITDSIFPEICEGDQNGSFSIKIVDGVAPYNTSLNNENGEYQQVVGAEQSFDNLSSGNHIVYIKDALNCTAQQEVFIPEPVKMNPTVTIDYGCEDNTAANSVSVTISHTITNPTDVDFSLDGGMFQPENTFKNLSPGSHIITTRHLNGCIQNTAPFTIDQINPLQVTLTSSELNEIVATASEGAGNYQYSFEGESFSSKNKIIIYKSGLYTVTVKDYNDCTNTISKYFEYVDVCIPNYFTPNADGINDEWVQIAL